MNQHNIYDKSIDTFIPIEAKQPLIATLPKEESLPFQGLGWQYNANPAFPNQFQGEESTSDILLDLPTAAEVNSKVRTPNKMLAAEFAGAITINKNYNINSDFANFKLVDLQASSTLFNGSSLGLDNFATDLYSNSYTGGKVINVFNGMQLLKIPLNTFPSLGLYYVCIMPKYIETEVIFVTEKVHKQFKTGLQATDIRFSQYDLDRAPFENTIWQFFEGNPLSNNPYHTNRLFGSVVEILNSSKTEIKQSKVIGGNKDMGTAFSITLHPNNVGFDSPQNDIAVGDILRIYPRETYFEPIYLQFNVYSKNKDINTILSNTTNDAVRDLETGIISIYDENGVTINPDGTIDGTVEFSYYLFNNGNLEIRKKITN